MLVRFNFNKRHLLILFLTCLGLSTATFIFFSPPVSAADVGNQIGAQVIAGGQSAGFARTIDPRRAASEIIQIALGTIGSIFIVLMVMSGYWYITAQGEESKIEKATKTARGAVVGVILVLLAYSITIFVSQKSQEALKAPRSESVCKWYSLWFCSAVE